MGYRKPSEAIRAWEGCRKAQDWVRDTLNLSNGEANQLSDTLDEYETEVQAQVEQLQEEQARQDAYEHPPVDQMLYGGQKFITINDAIKNLDLGDYGEDAMDYVNGASYIDDALQEAADGMVDIYYHDLLHWLPDNYEWLEEADAQGLLEGCKGDLMKMTQAAQYECYSQNLYDHKADILAAVSAPAAQEGPREEVKRMNGMRKAIARNMQNSHMTSPTVTFNLGCDVTELARLRARLKADDIKVSYTDILVKLVAVALREFPLLNCSVEDNKIIYKHYVNMGVAVALDNGLVVPNVPDADKKSLTEISAEVKELAKLAREGGLPMDRLTGGTFTISSLGPYGITSFSPIINQPELAILGVTHAGE